MMNILFSILNQQTEDTPNDLLDQILAIQDAKMENLTRLTLPSRQAEPRHTFTATIPKSETSISSLSIRQRMAVLPTMARLIREMNRSGNYYRERFVAKHQTASPEQIEQIRNLAMAHGATAVQFVKVPADSIFTGKAIPEPYAIVFTVRMDKEKMDTAPSFEAFHEVAKGYKRMAIISNIVSRFMRNEGFAAYPGTALGGLTDYSRLAEVAGLGAIGYHGLLITPEDGALLRLNTIYTNISNLPLLTHNPHKWIRDFCAKCRKCIRKCPPKAIFDQPQVQKNGRVKCIDGKACLDYFAANHGCAICIDICPFSQMGYDVIQARFKGNPDAPIFDIPMVVGEMAKTETTTNGRLPLGAPFSG